MHRLPTSPPCRHHPSDVIAGAFLGTLLGGLFAGRAISRLDRVVLGAGGGADDGTPGAAASLLRAAPGSNGSSIA